MKTNLKSAIRVFDIDNPPEDFDPYIQHGGRRRYAIIYVKNEIGKKFFNDSPWKSNGDCDSYRDFITYGFKIFRDIEKIPYAVRRNAVEFSFITQDFNDVQSDITDEDMEFYRRVGCVLDEGTISDCDSCIKRHCGMTSHTENREDFTNERNCDFALLREYHLDFNDEGEIETDSKIVEDVCYNGDWAYGRYFLRIRCLSANLSERTKDELNFHICSVISYGSFCGGRFELSASYYLGT